MMNNKHIGMWACPRSRSTVITRAFEQLDGCMVYDEPVIGPYRWIRRENFRWEAATEIAQQKMETDYKKVIELLTGDLPEGKQFSFQKLSTDEYLPEFGTEWVQKLTNFFLIRHPKDILLSLHEALEKQNFHHKKIDEELVGLKALHHVFIKLKDMTGKIPLVISSDDVVKDPHHTLKYLCAYLEVEFHENMLIWESGLKNSVLSQSSMLTNPESEPWYMTLRNSQSFLPYEKKDQELPIDLTQILEESMSYYNALLQHCHVFSELTAS